MLSERQLAIVEWLKLKLQLPVYAEAFEGAIYLLKQRSPGCVSFVSHTGRDIMNLLARTVVGITSSRTPYFDMVNELQKYWKDEWRGQGLVLPPKDDEGHLIPYHICEMINSLIKAHQEGNIRSHRADELYFNIFLGYPEKDRIPSLRQWKEIKKFFEKHNHLREGTYSADDVSKLEDCFNVLEEFLHIAAISEYSRMRTLDEILEQTNK